MKKTVALLLSSAMILSLCSCNTVSNAVKKALAELASTESTVEEEEKIPYDYDLSQYITLGEYKGLTYVPASTEPTEEGIWDRIVETLQYCGLYDAEIYPDLLETNLTEGEVRYGDIVAMDITTRAGGKIVTDGTGTSLATEIGGNFFTSDITSAEAETAGFSYEFLTQFLTDIEKEAVGKTVGTPFTVKGTFPEDNFEESLVGEAYEMEITVTKIGKRYGHPDTLNATEIALVGEYDDQAACLEGVKETLESNDFDTSEGEIWHYIAYVLNYNGYYNKTLYKDYYKENLTGGTVMDGDIVYISFEGSVEGTVMDSACSDGTTLEIGSDSYIDGFESGLIGQAIGSTVTLNLNFPDPYTNNTDLSGKPVSFVVTIHLVTKRYEHPDVLPAEIMQELYDLGMASSENFDDLWEQMKEEEITELEEDAFTEKETQVITQIKENSTLIAYPDGEVEAYVTSLEEEFTEMATYYGCSDLEEFLSYYYGMTYDDFKERAQLMGEDEVFTMMVVYQIARTEGYDKLEDSVYEEKAAKYVTAFEVTDYAALCEEYGTYQVKEWVLCDMVTDLVLDTAVAVEE